MATQPTDAVQTNAPAEDPTQTTDPNVAVDNPSGTTSQTTDTANQTTPAQSAVAQAESELVAAQQASADAQEAAINAQLAVDKAEEEYAIAQESGDPVAIDDTFNVLDKARAALDQAMADQNNAAQAVDDAQTSLDQANAASGSGDATGVKNQSSADATTKAQNANPSNIDTAKNAIGGFFTGIGTSIKGLFGGGTLNSQPNQVKAGSASFGPSKDMRVKLRVPSAYLTGPAAGPAAGMNLINSPLTNALAPSSGGGTGALAQLGGIVWPYTPQVSISNQASYQQNKVMHSNYPFYNYQNSSVGPIQVSGKFTAQNEYEAAIILSIQHLLRALTKMKFGDDPDAGAPPPVCRFDAYGDYQMKNVPVAVTGFKVEMPDGVDYIQVGKGITGYGNTMVPTVCTISVDLVVMYSRQEALQFNVNSWLSGGLAGKGYL